MTNPTKLPVPSAKRLRSVWESDQSDWSFRLRSMGSQGPNVSLCEQRRLWSSRADAHADLSLCWGTGHFVNFVMLWLIMYKRSRQEHYLQTKWHVRLTEAQVRFCIRAFWSGSLLRILELAKDPTLLHVDSSVDTDQIASVWLLIGRTCPFVYFALLLFILVL